MKAIAIVGIGRELRGDDAAGLRAVETWQAMYPETAEREDIHVHKIQTADSELLATFRGAKAAILVDAVCAGGKPGTIYQLGPEDLLAGDFFGASAHGWGAVETLALARLVDPDALPSLIGIVGIELEYITVGDDLSEAVRLALGPAAHAIQDFVAHAQEARPDASDLIVA